MNDEYEPTLQPNSDPEPVTEPAAEPSAPTRKSGKKIAIAAILLVVAIVIFGSGFLCGMLLFRNRNSKAGDSTALSTGQVAERVSPAVVLIRATNNAGTQSYGTGFFIRSDGYLLTNYHVVENMKSITVILYPGENKKTAKIVGYDKELDLALLRIAGADYPTVAIGDSDIVAIGDKAIAIGNPSGEKCAWSVTQGIISAKRVYKQESTDRENSKMIQTDAPINHGNSGGPLLNDKGEVIGVISSKLADTEGIGLAIPINDAMKVVGEWLPG